VATPCRRAGGTAGLAGVAGALVVLLLLLVDAPGPKLLSSKAAAATGRSRQRPVVLIVFDEFPTNPLMNRAGRIDAQRFPNFAALARNSTWFRNATTVMPDTPHAVPAIFTGRIPAADTPPTFTAQPRNLFTLLAGSYRIESIEAATALCPPRLCRKQATQGEPPTGPYCSRAVCTFTSTIQSGHRPALYSLHAILPHVPWVYLPSGKRYGGDTGHRIPGAKGGIWRHDPWLATQAEQHFILQLAYTDHALGLILDRLRERGLYDRALVVVTADHGESFRPGTLRRHVEPANLVDIAFVPLFVKLPNQRRGRIDDSFVQTIDILPTIAAALHMRIPWHVDGKPLIGSRLPADGTVAVDRVRSRLRVLLVQRRRSLAAQLRTFGTGPMDRVYRIGPNRQLLGRSVDSLPVRPSSGEGVRISGHELLGAVDLSLGQLPTYLNGTLLGPRPTRQNVAIAVNGTIAAVTRSYEELGETKFAAIVPESSLQAGANDVRVYAVDGPVLTELRPADLTYTLGPKGLEASDGTTIPIGTEIAGEVRGIQTSDGLTIGGWAANLRTHRAAESIVVLVDGRSVFVAQNRNNERRDILKRYGIDEAGFVYTLPGGLLHAAGTAQQVRVFAIAGIVASELRYLPGYPWVTAGRASPREGRAWIRRRLE